MLRFLPEPAVPFTHHQAEQDVRMRDMHQKISDGSRAEGRSISPRRAVYCQMHGRRVATASRPGPHPFPSASLGLVSWPIYAATKSQTQAKLLDRKMVTAFE